MTNDTTPTNPRTFSGSCHCGAIRYEVDLDLSKGVGRCNCSICHRLARASAIVPPADFRLLAGGDGLGEYGFGSRSGKYLFCKVCGIHAYGTGHLDILGGDFVSVNVHCLDGVEVQELPVMHWDGRHDNWDAGPRDTPWPLRAAG